MSQELTGASSRAETDFDSSYSGSSSENLERRTSTYTATALVIIAWSLMLTMFFSIALAVTIVARPDNRGLTARMDESRQEIEFLGVSVYVSFGQLALALGAALVISLFVWRVVLAGVRSD